MLSFMICPSVADFNISLYTSCMWGKKGLRQYILNWLVKYIGGICRTNVILEKGQLLHQQLHLYVKVLAGGKFCVLYSEELKSLWAFSKINRCMVEVWSLCCILHFQPSWLTCSYLCPLWCVRSPSPSYSSVAEPLEFLKIRDISLMQIKSEQSIKQSGSNIPSSLLMVSSGRNPNSYEQVVLGGLTMQ